MCSAELPRFLCLSLIWALFSHESDILPQAYFSLILTPTSPAMCSFLLPTACPPIHRCPTTPVAPKSGLSQETQCQKEFRALLSHISLLSTSRQSSTHILLDLAREHPPAEDHAPSSSPWGWDCASGAASSRPLFWLYLSPSMPPRD